MTKYKIRKNFLIVAILATGLISALIGVVAYFGLNMGTFVIALDETAYKTGISLSTEPEFISSYPRLLVNPVNNCYPVAYQDVNVEDAINTNGDYTDPKGSTYIAYTFYIKNEGDTTVNLAFDVDITQVTKNVDTAVRVMVVEDGLYQTIYLKDDNTRKHPYDKTPDDLCEYFYDDTKVCYKEIENFKPNDVKKFTIIIWLEGWDEGCNDNIKSGQLKMKMTFNVISAKLEEENK